MCRTQIVVGVLLVALTAGCSSSQNASPPQATATQRQQVLDKNRPYFQDVRQKLKTIAGKLPAEGSLPAKNSPIVLSPPLGSTSGGTNYEVLLEKQLLDPEFQPGGTDENAEGEELSFERHARDHLLRSLRWTGPKSEEFLATAPQQLDWNIKNALEVRYVVVVRATKYEKASFGGGARTARTGIAAFMNGGVVDMEVSIADLTTGEIVGSFVVNSDIQNAKRPEAFQDVDQMAYEDLISTLKELTAEKKAEKKK